MFVADKGCDSKYIREQITKKDARAVASRKYNSVKGNRYELELGLGLGLGLIPILGGKSSIGQ